MEKEKQLEIGKISQFIVKRETDISYTLSPLDPDLTNYVFLHFNQATRRLNPGELINCFLYYDQKKRLCATMEKPIITTEVFGFVKVVNTNKAGVFVDIGISKDILLSSDFLPKQEKLWPIVGDSLPCILKVKNNSLVAKPINKNQHETKKLSLNETYSATVINISDEGIVTCTKSLNTIFIHKSLIRKSYRIGEVINVKIININKSNEYNGTTIERKELSRLSDSEIILNYLKTMGGSIPLGNASTPEQISKYFKMSKSAFKRAVGALYKNRMIKIDDYKITLI